MFVALHRGATAGAAPVPAIVTASPCESRDHADSGEEMVEPVAMPSGLVALIRSFCEAHREEETFVKRRRNPAHADAAEEGVGDPRIRQAADPYPSPSSRQGVS